ncbi:ABC transporter substrate-binding protein [Musicola paradisiaca]|uniref:Extracellular solute-binding protein family 1 n=1 Tax=Musicola paradisiaca (strain Ech703) TaxID=579405 RepID=C6CDN0_MUSP7|nr:extracellular solute-binding protein [Musicola paradisiaca]ACS85147.1 extracellular solute-binding protein family 1 [Musicola paradisiaca Ech703]
MRKLLSLSLSVLLACGLMAQHAAADVITLKLWTLNDRNAPMRITNITDAAEVLNRQFAAAGVDRKIVVDVHASAVQGWDDLALDTLKAFGVNQGPDMVLLPHEWIGEFARNGYAMPMDNVIKANPWVYADILPVLWEAMTYRGKVYGVPQDAEIRMFFYNKDMLRKIGKDEAFIDSLPARVDRGEFTLDDLTALAGEVVKGGAAPIGMLHRPNVGIDYLMVFAAYGAKFMDEKTGRLLFPKKEMEAALGWYARNAAVGVTPSDNTAMSWDTIQTAFKQEKAFLFHQGIWAMAWQVNDNFGPAWPADKAGYTHKIGWIPAPAAVKGGKPANLSHPIAYVVSDKSQYKDLAAQLVSMATLPYYNNRHDVTSYHTAISHAQQGMPQYTDNWALSDAGKMMKNITFVPNHTRFGDYNRVLFKGLQAVETKRMTPAQAVAFIADELDVQLGNDVEIVDSLH